MASSLSKSIFFYDSRQTIEFQALSHPFKAFSWDNEKKYILYHAEYPPFSQTINLQLYEHYIYVQIKIILLLFILADIPTALLVLTAQRYRCPPPDPCMQYVLLHICLDYPYICQVCIIQHEKIYPYTAYTYIEVVCVSTSMNTIWINKIPWYMVK